MPKLTVGDYPKAKLPVEAWLLLPPRFERSTRPPAKTLLEVFWPADWNDPNEPLGGFCYCGAAPKPPDGWKLG